MDTRQARPTGRGVRWAAWAALALLLSAQAAAQAAGRVALVIGNSAYVHTDPLRNPGNDADAMAAALVVPVGVADARVRLVLDVSGQAPGGGLPTLRLPNDLNASWIIRNRSAGQLKVDLDTLPAQSVTTAAGSTWLVYSTGTVLRGVSLT